MIRLNGVTAEGKAGLDALVRDPGTALIASDFDGTLAPIVREPSAARPQPGAIEALTRLAATVGTVAIVTGRPAASAIQAGGLDAVPGVIVLGHYGAERWQGGQLSEHTAPPGVQIARRELPGILQRHGDPEGARIEDKGIAVAVHTRQAADPDGLLATLRPDLRELADRAGLALEPGRFVLELRPPGTDKGTALRELVTERTCRSVVYCGDDLGDLAAYAAVRQLRTAGIPGCTVCSASPEAAPVAAEADLVADGPAGVVAFLERLASDLPA